jgi:hypothetical protein
MCSQPDATKSYTAPVLHIYVWASDQRLCIDVHSGERLRWYAGIAAAGIANRHQHPNAKAKSRADECLTVRADGFAFVPLVWRGVQEFLPQRPMLIAYEESR